MAKDGFINVRLTGIFQEEDELRGKTTRSKTKKKTKHRSRSKREEKATTTKSEHSVTLKFDQKIFQA